MSEAKRIVRTPVPDAALAHRLVVGQFRQWAHLPLRAVEPGGWDHCSFRLGEELLVRLPRAAEYAAQVEKEHAWLPRLAPQLPLEIPTPIALGAPSEDYAWPWSVYRWIDGEAAAGGYAEDLVELARGLAAFLRALQGVSTSEGPLPGAHNFHRGGHLSTYDREARSAITSLSGEIDAVGAMRCWEAALETPRLSPSVWVHGDVAAGNLILRGGRLAAVIDFGQLGVGDPACDLAIAWTLFEGPSREAFREQLPQDAATWARARGWALWKAAIVAAGQAETNEVEAAQARRTLDAVLGDHG